MPDRAHWENLAAEAGHELCFILADGDGGDDARSIEEALNGKCQKDALVVFPDEDYSIQTTMNTTGLDNVQLHIYGTLTWTPDVEFWRSVSMPMGFQNQSTVWFFGGRDVLWDGHGVGTVRETT